MSNPFKPKLIDNADDVDKRNIEVFSEHGALYKPEELRHTCLVCGRKVSINDSRSNEGHNLVCGRCYYDESVFPKTFMADSWINEMAIIRCKDCESYWKAGDDDCFTADTCSILDMIVEPDDFCCWARRKTPAMEAADISIKYFV